MNFTKFSNISKLALNYKDKEAFVASQNIADWFAIAEQYKHILRTIHDVVNMSLSDKLEILRFTIPNFSHVYNLPQNEVMDWLAGTPMPLHLKTLIDYTIYDHLAELENGDGGLKGM